MKRPVEKIKITEEMLKTQNSLIAFLKRNPEIRATRIHPFGHAVDISTITEDKTAEFLQIVNP